MKLSDSSGLNLIEKDMEYLCLSIGNRIAGSPEEEKAAEYTLRRFKELGMTNEKILPFSCTRWFPGIGELVVLDDPGWTIRGEVLAHSFVTPDEGVEGELAIFEPIDWEKGIRSSDFAGKIGLFYGSYGESSKIFEQLQHSTLRALIFVDTRLQTDWPIANGVGEKFMALIQKPVMYISLMDAWYLAQKKVRSVRLTCTGEKREAASQNVVGEYPGDDSKGKIIVLSGHLDSVAVGCGADDNASGIAAILECARRLKGLPGRNTLRFIGFGAEEQLSVGSTHYVKEQAEDLDRVAFICNFDGIAAWLGISEVMVTGTPDLENYVKQIVDVKQGFGTVFSDVSPYQDQFPFARYEIPGLWYTRKTHKGACWYHHSAYNNLDVCSAVQIAKTAESACEVIKNLAEKDTWPFRKVVSEELKKKITLYEAELFN